jgi:protein-S-isoprenylcysteine O-methyltransferase Ste14
MLWFFESFFPVVRHPIYTGILTGFLGAAIALSRDPLARAWKK